MAVDNTEALGALRDGAIRAEDVEAGRYDHAEVRAWLVNWADTAQRHLLFRGTIGEIRRAGAAFEAELRGLTQPLNLPLGRAYHTSCAAVLGDAACGVDLAAPEFSCGLPAGAVTERRVFRLSGLREFDAGWFQSGRLRVETGAAQGLTGMIKRDRAEGEARIIELWHPLRADVVPGDLLRLEAGCDKRMPTCRGKFNNLKNFRGFPDIPGDDWSVTDPARSGGRGGGSRRS